MIKIDCEKKLKYLPFFEKYQSLTKKFKNDIYDFCLEIAYAHESMTESKKEILREAGIKEERLVNTVFILFYPPQYEKDLKKGIHCSSEAYLAFTDRNLAINKLDEFNIIESYYDKKLFSCLDDNYWIIRFNMEILKRFIKQIENERENDTNLIEQARNLVQKEPRIEKTDIPVATKKKTRKKAKKITMGYVPDIKEINNRFQVLINDKVYAQHNQSSPSYYVYKFLIDNINQIVSFQDMRNAVYDKIHRTSELNFNPKDLSTFLGKLGFKRDVKNVFF